MKAIAFFLIAAFLLVPLIMTGQTGDEENRHTLRGIKNVRLVITANLPEDLKGQLGQGQLRTGAELRLRRSGIPIAESWAETLYVLVDVLKIPIPDVDAYCYAVRTLLKQAVYIVRFTSSTDSAPRDAQELRAYATTWSVGTHGFAGGNRVAIIREAVGDQVDEFASAFLAANPREGGAGVSK